MRKAVEDHKKWLKQWLKTARAEMVRRDWLAASNALRSAAFHEQIILLGRKSRR